MRNPENMIQDSANAWQIISFLVCNSLKNDVSSNWASKKTIRNTFQKLLYRITENVLGTSFTHQFFSTLITNNLPTFNMQMVIMSKMPLRLFFDSLQKAGFAMGILFKKLVQLALGYRKSSSGKYIETVIALYRK